MYLFRNLVKQAQDINRLNAILQELNEPAHPDTVMPRIELCREALALRSREDRPKLWAKLQDELGYNLARAPLPDLASNLELAIEAFNNALQVRTQRDAPNEWVETMGGLASAYVDRLRGDKAENLETVLNLLQQILQVADPETMPENWAVSMTNLANAYADRLRGDRAQNLEKAIAAYWQVEEFNRTRGERERWALVMNNLAATYRDRLLGNGAENMEMAIQCCEQALQVFTLASNSAQWATTMNNLGTIYFLRLQGDRANNLERAIAAYQQVLRVRTPDHLPMDWAGTMSDLAGVYLARIKGERTQNLEMAIDYGERALTVRTRERTPFFWAITMNNLGAVYQNRIRGDANRNLMRAIDIYKSALEVLTREEIPFEWARTMTALGSAYTALQSGDRADNLEHAISVYERALTVRTRESMPRQWALTMMNLATAYSDRLMGDREENVDRAIAYYLEVAEVRNRQASPFEWAQLMVNLGRAYEKKLSGDRKQNIELASKAWHQALEVFVADSMPAEHLQVQNGLGMIFFEARHWEQTYGACTAAMAVIDSLYLSSATPEARQSALGQINHIAVRAAYSLAKLGQPARAVEILEHNKARAISEALARNSAALEKATLQDREEFAAARATIASLEAEARSASESGAGDFVALSEKLGAARQQLLRIAERVHTYVPDFMPAAFSFADIENVATQQQQPLIYLLTSEHGSLALFVSPASTSAPNPQLLFIDEFQSHDLEKILIADQESPYLPGVFSNDPKVLKQALDKVLPLLESKLVGGLSKKIQESGYNRATLIAGMLGLLPLANLVSDSVCISLVPSARTLQTAHQALGGQEASKEIFLGISNPLPSIAPLPFARLEVETIMEMVSKEDRYALFETHATSAALMASLNGATILHFACHGSFNIADPLSSSLYLAGDDRLTLRDILDGKFSLSTVRLVILSACQTGLVDVQQVPDESVGFPGAFLQSGVAGTISTLWPVNDISTALLLIQFYKLILKEHVEPPLALLKAQQWLRRATAKDLNLDEYWEKCFIDSGRSDKAAFRWWRYYAKNIEERPYAHPYYWMPFVYTGASKFLETPMINSVHGEMPIRV